MGWTLLFSRYAWLALSFSLAANCDGNWTRTGQEQVARGDILQYVDPLIGTAAGGKSHSLKLLQELSTKIYTGHVFAGATLPFGMLILDHG